MAKFSSNALPVSKLKCVADYLNLKISLLLIGLKINSFMTKVPILSRPVHWFSSSTYTRSHDFFLGYKCIFLIIITKPWLLNSCLLEQTMVFSNFVWFIHTLKNVTAFLFSLHNTISLSRHEEVRLMTDFLRDVSPIIG